MNVVSKTRLLLKAASVLAAVALPMAVIGGVLDRTWLPVHAQDGTDLAAGVPEKSLVVGDWQALTVSGRMSVEVTNLGDEDTSDRFTVAFFEDSNENGELDVGTDVVFGTADLQGLTSGATEVVSAPLSGHVRFRDNLVFASVDSGDTVAETDEANNVTHTGQACERRPAPGQFDPHLEWEWTGSRVLPAFDQVMMAPAVIDLTDDDVPDIVFISFRGTEYRLDGHLRAIHGDGRGDIFTVVDPRYDTYGSCAIATGDIDQDGHPEIIAVSESRDRLLAFEHDGAFKWRTPVLNERLIDGGPSIADIDHDGLPEIVVGASVVNGDGSVRWSVSRSQPYGRSQLSFAINLDLAGDLEVVSGNTAHRADGTLLWFRDDLTSGFNAVGNFDDDPYPEIVLVSQGQVFLLEHDGATKWGPVSLPGVARKNFGGPPTVADVDGDGEPEIGVAGGAAYTVFETDGQVKWSQLTQDYSSAQTGSSVFDFEGDGAAEVIYGDELRLRIYRGTDGQVLWDIASPSGTTYELPIIVDVDADGNTEIVMISNNYFHGGSTGVQVYGDANDTWVRTRQIWNQHAYHIDNVSDDGTIPRSEQSSWLDHNSFRLNLPMGNVFAAPDLTASFLRLDTSTHPTAVQMTARIGNGGAIGVAAGQSVAFYDGDPGGGRTLIGTAVTSQGIEPGRFEEVSIVWASPPPGGRTVFVVADDDGAGHGSVSECDELNNVHQAPYEVVPTPTATPTPSLTATPAPSLSTTPSPTATPAPSLTVTPSPTPTPAPSPVYLPLLLRERHSPKRVNVDVVLVMDASHSMRGEKLAAAKGAAEAFIGEMRLPDDQLAVVAFNSTAWVASGLTGNPIALAKAVNSIEISPGTRIDRGLLAALEALESVPDRVDRERAIVLLTDGRQYEEPASAQAAADDARRKGVAIYAVGLGADIDVVYLTSLASTPDHTYLAPGPNDLTAIYLKIAVEIPCRPEQFWGGRC